MQLKTKQKLIRVFTRLSIFFAIVSAFLWFVLVSINSARKPAIYLYPTEDSVVNVKLRINGLMTKSLPEYNNGWNVFATKEGLIEGEYDYLFYEAKLLKMDFPDSGWVVRYEDLDKWFEVNLTTLGLNEKEKSQFMEYWVKELPKSNYYEIKLAGEKFLNENMALDISPKPDTVIRLLFNFRPLKNKTTIQEPNIITPERKGFTVVEWGGILDK